MANFSAVYWLAADARVMPYVVFWLVDDAGGETLLNTAYQGNARVQFDLWDTSQIRCARLRTVLRKKVRYLNEASGGSHVMTGGVTEQTIQRESNTDPYHFVVDGVIKWNEE